MNRIKVFAPPSLTFNGTLEFAEPKFEKFFPNQKKNRNLSGSLIYGELILGELGARRSFCRAAIEALELSDYQCTPLEALPSLGKKACSNLYDSFS